VESALEAAATRSRAALDAAVREEGAEREALARAEAAHEAAQRDVAAAEEALSLAGEPDPARREALGAEEAEVREARVRVAARLHHDDQSRAAVAGLGPEIERQQARADRWASLAAVIGSADGARFRVFAQGLTLDALVAHANEHLRQLAPRYRLARVPGQDLELQVIDRALGGEPRGVNSLSGGETFLASLALALGLSSLASQQVRVQSLFIDEGFGTLDPDTLDGALSVLDELQSTGRQIGIISHVPGLGERFGVRVEVLPVGAGRAAVRTVA
jgi:exonuclease SbcC